MGDNNSDSRGANASGARAAAIAASAFLLLFIVMGAMRAATEPRSASHALAVDDAGYGTRVILATSPERPR